MSRSSTPVQERRQAPPDLRTTWLATCGAVAGPLYVVSVGTQAATREGFDPRHHAASLLSNGDLGWVQILTFVATGLLTVAGAVGLRRRVAADPGARRAATLIGVFGASLVGAGALVADPAFGFPAGTPDGAPTSISWQGAGHLVSGGVGFVALTAACLLLARRFAARGAGAWARWSVTSGVALALSFGAVASGSGGPPANLALGGAVILAWAWLTGLTSRGADVLADAPGPDGSPT